MLDKTDFYYSIQQMIDYLPLIDWDNDGRASITVPTGHWLYEPYKLAVRFQGTPFAKFLDIIPFEYGEVRLMKMSPGTCYRAHADIDDRLHINLTANEHCHLIDLNANKMYPIKTDGYIYMMDGSRIHTAVNFGSTDRVQLVLRVPLKECDVEDGVYCSIKFINPPHDLRYKLDQHISPLLNQYVKSGDLGYFNRESDTKFLLNISQDALNTVVDKLEQAGIDFSITR